MCGAIPPLPQYAFMTCCLVKAQGQLYLLPFTLSLWHGISLVCCWRRRPPGKEGRCKYIE